MVKRLSKVTHGFVVQQFEEVGGALTCVGQEFVAGDDVTWETPDGEVPDETPDEAYQSFDMVQPVVEPVVESVPGSVGSVRGLLKSLLGVGVDRLDDGVSVYCAGRGEYFPVDEVWIASGSDVVDDGEVVLIVQD